MEFSSVIVGQFDFLYEWELQEEPKETLSFFGLYHTPFLEVVINQLSIYTFKIIILKWRL